MNHTINELLEATTVWVKYEQGSPEWFAWRERTGIGASEVPAIMGEYPGLSRKRLMDEKLKLKKHRENKFMYRGKENEPRARAAFSLRNGLYVPFCAQRGFMGASFDGIQAEYFGFDVTHFPEGLEIKVPTATVQDWTVEHHAVPPKNYGQVQAQLFVGRLEVDHYYSWHPLSGGEQIDVVPDEEYIERMLREVTAFYNEFLERKAELAKVKGGW